MALQRRKIKSEFDSITEVVVKKSILDMTRRGGGASWWPVRWASLKAEIFKDFSKTVNW